MKLNLSLVEKKVLMLLMVDSSLLVPVKSRSLLKECAYTLFVVAIFWLTEALPLAVSALLPAFMFPLFGIMASKQVASAYFKDFHLLLIGVICLATSIEKWNFHKRVALRMVMLVGVNPAWLTLGFMVSCSFLSMWLSNTSAAAMVMPIVEAVAVSLTHIRVGLWIRGVQAATPWVGGKAPKRVTERKGLPEILLHTRKGRSYMGNLWFSSQLPSRSTLNIPDAAGFSGTSDRTSFLSKCINFGSWFILSIPITVIILLLSWVWLQWLFLGFDLWRGQDFKSMFRCGKEKTAREQASAQVIREEYKKLGPISYPEIVTLVLFILMTLLWFTRDPGFIPGWSSLFPKYKGFATDSTTALVIDYFKTFFNPFLKCWWGFFLLFFSLAVFGYTPLITWKEFQSCMPWEIAILVGGGFALADGCEVSNLSAWVGNKLTPLGSLPLWLIILISCLIVTSVTEVASNPATITIFLPILSPLAEAIHVNPLFILIPTTLCTSFAFLLPVANPANAIVFSYGHLTIMDMVTGLGINIIGVAVVMLGIMTWIVPIFDLYTYPSWAPIISSTNNTGL
uniref:Solute carrier family 13 member 1 n=1 Tax=Apteryx owenii TaxID=8824 RepID=A0A8B9QPD6_APTOW